MTGYVVREAGWLDLNRIVLDTITRRVGDYSGRNAELDELSELLIDRGDTKRVFPQGRTVASRVAARPTETGRDADTHGEGGEAALAGKAQTDRDGARSAGAT